MKRIFCLCLFCILSGGVLQAQAKYKNKANAEDKDWHQLIYRSWKVVHVFKKNMEYNILTDKTAKFSANVEFQRSGQALLYAARTVMYPSFAVIEHDSKRYLLIGPAAVLIEKLTRDSMVLQLNSSPIELNTLSLILVPEKMPQLPVHSLLIGNWQSSLFSDSRSDLPGAVILKLQENGDCILTQGSNNQQDKWTLDENKFEVALDINQKKDIYRVVSVSRGKLVLSYGSRQDSILALHPIPDQQLDNPDINSSLDTTRATQPHTDSMDYENSEGFRDDTTALSKQLKGTWQALSVADYPYDNEDTTRRPLSITFTENAFILQNGRKKIKGSWHAADDRSVLFLKADKQELYCPFSAMLFHYASGRIKLSTFELTVVPPGEEKVKVIVFGEPKK